MPTSTRRQVRSREQRGVQVVDMSDDPPLHDSNHGAESVGEVEGGGEDEGDEDEDVEDYDPNMEDMSLPPPGLKEISSLASWTVSTAKPGNGVAALRSPDTNLFWQSDGPQPHLLSIHFFKLVSIVHMRIFLDFANDESYTPTKIQFLAGMGVHDILEFAEMCFEQPTGWIDVDFSNVGPIEDEFDEFDENGPREIDWSKRPLLRAFLVQIRILENHQNGKDTHLRAVQLFARDDAHQDGREPSLSEKMIQPRKTRPQTRRLPFREPNNIKLAPWMMEPDLR
ncbi:anaphase-promoting complex subunit 10-like [Lecanosticta acicola]|uniref:Anaphase-promoting complex subunit 10-like n=1 Tax=Lecanosticta acicola TaxID=111012 RepID=A0AAI9E5B8_9PEZI|nr:anaphase-promoting complex subunit 10-like [Lecanosticta acicola]